MPGDLTALRGILQKRVDAGQPVLPDEAAITAAGFTPRPHLDAFVASRLLPHAPLAVTVTGQLPQPSGVALTFAGTANLLGVGTTTVHVTMSVAGDGNVDVTAGIELGASWLMGTTFPALAGEPFSETGIAGGHYVVTSATAGTYPWNGLDRPIAKGAQLFGTVRLTGPLAVILPLLAGAKSTDTATLTGTIDPSAMATIDDGLPALRLTAKLGHDIGVTHLKLSCPRIEIATVVDPDTKQLVAWLRLALTLMLDDNPLCDLAASLSSGAGTVALGMLPPEDGKAPPLTPGRLVSLLGGTDFIAKLPPEVKDLFKLVALKGLYTVIDTSDGSVLSAGVAIGTAEAWRMAPGVKIDALTMRVLLLRPFDPKARMMFTLDATAELWTEVFDDGLFEIELTYAIGDGSLQVAAGYDGPGVHLAKVMKGLSHGKAELPEAFPDVVFSEFGAVFDDPAAGKSTYQLHGKADATFPVTILGGTPHASLEALVDSASESYKLQGSLQLGDSLFGAEVDLVAGAASLSASWEALEKDYLTIEKLLVAVGGTAPKIPEGLDLDLKAARAGYDFTHRVLTLEATSATWGSADFVGLFGTPTKYFLGVKIDRRIDLVNLPLVASALHGSGQLAIAEMQALASSTLTADDAQEIARHLQASSPTPPEAGMSGLALTLDLMIGETKVPLTLALGSQTRSAAVLASPPQAVVPSLQAIASPPRAVTPSLGASASPLQRIASPPQSLPPSGRGVAPTASGGTSVPAPPAPSDGTTWFNLQKTFGPVAFQKVGIRYAEGELWLLINAALSVGGLTISVYGLGVGSPLTSFEPDFTISGLGVTLEEGPVEVSGALLGTIKPINFAGEVLVGFKEIKLGALAGYAEVDGHPSFFGYVVLNAPLGGPPEFFVTGLAAGVGFNRQLQIPHADGVADFPLVKWALGTSDPPSSAAGGDVGERVRKVVESLSQVVAPSVGEYWIAAGIRFTTYKILECFALLTAKFGAEFEIALLGVATVQIPPAPSPAVAEAQLALEASFAPATGLIAIGGQLTPASFVLVKECRLTGGFAFWTWVSGDHAGELVVTLGGYSPKFTPPSYYPTVPRLGVSFSVDSLHVNGGLFYALTSSAVMAGGSLTATWSKGDISAWFSAEADFLIVFEPFHYFIEIGIQLGASFKLDLWLTTISVTIHLGVDLQLWGPEFAGRAKIDLSIISFTVDFGASGQSTQKAIAWGDFVKRLLPHDQPAQSGVRTRLTAPGAEHPQHAVAHADDPQPAVLQILVTGGLLKELDGGDGIDFVADGQHLELVTKSAIPLKTWSTSPNLHVSTPAGQPEPELGFGIGPTDTSDDAFKPNHDVQITTTVADALFLGAPELANVATALWQHRTLDSHGVPQGVDPLKGTTIQNVATGVRIAPHAPDPHHTRAIPREWLLYTEDEQVQPVAWSGSSPPSSDPFTNETVWGTIAEAPVAANRAALVAAVTAAGLPVPEKIDIDELATEAAFDLLEPPALRLLGEQK